MRTRPRQLIPVGWDGQDDASESLWSNTMVIPIPHAPSQGYEVERVSGSRSPHIPEKAPHYLISNPFSWLNGYRPPPWGIQARRLDQVPVRKPFLVELSVHRKQRCFNFKGIRHGVLYSEAPYKAQTYCGQDLFTLREHQVDPVWVDDRVPDCPKCLAFKTAWVCLIVLSYTPVQEIRSKEGRVKKVTDRRLRLPTVYDRILADDPFDKKSYKTKPQHPIQAEEDPFAVYDEGERERKLRTAKARSLRLKNLVGR